jgi:hypothetical protein
MENDFHEEIMVARFWREVIGEYEYVNYDPDDLYRWYHALETRGPMEIRAYLNERGGKHPMPRLLGLVSKPPHPPMDVVMLWLESHEHKAHTAPFWLGMGGFVTLCLLLGLGYEGCANLKDPNILSSQAGQTSTPLMPPAPASAPLPTATLPTVAAAPTPSQGPSTVDGAPGYSASAR